MKGRRKILCYWNMWLIFRSGCACPLETYRSEQSLTQHPRFLFFPPSMEALILAVAIFYQLPAWHAALLLTTQSLQRLARALLQTEKCRRARWRVSEVPATDLSAKQEKGLLLGFKCQKKTDQEPCDTDGVLLFPHSRLFTSRQLNDYFSVRLEGSLDQSPRMILDPYKGPHPWDRACGGVLSSKKDQVHYLKYNASEDLGFSNFLKFLVSGNCPWYTFPSLPITMLLI